MSLALVMGLGMQASLPAAEAHTGATVTIDAQAIVNDNFLGIGAEYDPFSFMPESIANGYNNNWWEVEKRRLAKLQPDIVRVWYQIDWMEPVNDNGDPDVIDWSGMQTNSPKMQALYSVLDELQQLEIDVMLVAGWKMTPEVQSWLGFPGLDKPETSAPTDLEEWAEWVSASVQQLIVNKGYTNIKYLQSYNEPNLGDFETPSHIDQKSYYEAMYRAIDDRLTADGVRDLVLLSGPDESSGLDWLQYAAANMDDILDLYQGHAYGKDYETMGDWIDERAAFVEPTGKPLLVTEFAAPGDKTTYQNGLELADLIVSGMRNQASAMLMWRMSDQHIPAPLNFLDSAEFGTWPWLPHSGTPRYTYYALGLFTRFIEAHDQVLSTISDDADLHVTSVKRADGHYSVFVINKSRTADKQVTLQFSEAVNKSVRRHLYSGTLTPSADAQLIPSDKSWSSIGTSLTDTVLPANSVAVYTTVAEPVQIALTPGEVSAAFGSQVDFASQMSGGSHGVSWSVIGGPAYGTIDSSGVYTAPVTMPAMQQAIVKGTSQANPEDYDLAIVRFRVQGLTAVGDDESIQLAWEPTAGAASYNVKRSLSPNGPFTTIASQVTTTSYLDTGLTNGVGYSYVVSAVNSNGETANSLTASAVPTANALEDDFEGSAIDSNKWQVIDRGLRSTAPTGLTAGVANGVLTISGTSSVNFWGGRTLQSVTPFHVRPGEAFSVEVDRVSMSGTGTGTRSGLWLFVDNTSYLRLSQNMDTGVWAYNLNGGSDVQIYANNDYGNHRMKMVHDGSSVKLYVDDVEYADVPVSWNQEMYILLSGETRASGDTSHVVFDNLQAGPVSP
ncbi:hypothetical protein [Paenibacillus sp. 1P07SE]|uniref:hypothetical protein n=1 Tax=Paenibacillus sp. 1P07SE TaxID=3132209 RepID=UPI0039A491E3